MLLGLELLFIAWAVGSVAKGPKKEDRGGAEEDDCKTASKYYSGYDLSKDVLWELEQKYKYCK